MESLKLKDYEKKIIQYRINGTSICITNENELKLLVEVSIFKISAISGFSLPSTTEFADVLNDEFCILLKEGFDNLTFDEVVEAFRLNARGCMRYLHGDFIQRVKNYSTFFNIEYASQVLDNYVSYRKHIDSRIKNEILDGINTGVDYDKYKKIIL